MMLQIAYKTAIALVMLTTGESKSAAERTLASITLGTNAHNEPMGSMLTIEGCKLYRLVDARGDSYYAISGYDSWERDVDRALSKADKVVSNWGRPDLAR